MFVNDATIGAVVEQIQRYHAASIAVPDITLAQQTVTGLYDLRDPDRALRALVQPHGGKVCTRSPASLASFRDFKSNLNCEAVSRAERAIILKKSIEPIVFSREAHFEKKMRGGRLEYGAVMCVSRRQHFNAINERTANAAHIVCLLAALVAADSASRAFAQTGPGSGIVQVQGGDAAVPRNFNIPAQPLGLALNAFGRQSGLQVTLSAATSRGLTSTAVSGSLLRSKRWPSCCETRVSRFASRPIVQPL